MRWPWSRRHDEDGRARRRATAHTERTLAQERDRLDEAVEIAASLASHRERNRFAEAMKVALGGRP